MKIPPRALNAANRILASVTSTRWTPTERDTAAAIIANETGQEKAIDACRKLLTAFPEGVQGRTPETNRATLSEAYRLAELALRR